MSEKESNASYPKKRTDTLIGPQVRIEGNIDFRGALRVQGDVVGDVVCSADSRGTLVVDASGSVSGAVRAPHLLVRGRVRGPSLVVQSLEIQAGAHCVGDTSYRTIDVHLGGVLEGLMTPSAGRVGEDSAPETPDAVVEPAPSVEFAASPSDEAPRPGSPVHRRRLAWGLVALGAVLTVVWVRRQPADQAPTTLPAPVEAVAAPVMPATAAAGSGSQEAATAGAAASAVPVAEAKVAAPAANPAAPEPEINKVVTVQGLNPAKSADVVFLVSREPAVLFKKKRDDATVGKQIELGQGRNVSVALARNEMLRVAKGRQLEIFYQGRKVPPENIESGVWMRFVPQLAGDATAAANPR